MFFADLERPDWAREGRDWPNRGTSQFVRAGGLSWHVQAMGEGPVLLLLHGTGAATHSWRALMPLLARHYRVIAPDLPGHGFSGALPARDMSLPGMAKAVAMLLARLDVAPEIVAGHSAGAAILARMCLDGAIHPRLLIALNGAFLPFEGLAGQLFPPMAKVLFSNPLAPRLFAWSADRAAVERLLRGTGSAIEARGLDFYARLFGFSGHVAGALAMMANWDLAALELALPKMQAPVALIVGAKDLAIAPAAAKKVQALLGGAQVETLKGCGHLAHEEQPEAAAALMLHLMQEVRAHA